MKTILLFLLSCSTLAIAKDAMAGDQFLELKKREFGVGVSRERDIKDYAEINKLQNETKSNLRVLVTTEYMTPNASAYSAAEAFHEGLKQTFPLAEFKAFGNVDNREQAAQIRANYDYVFLIGTNESSNDYEHEETVYGSRTSSVQCTPSLTGNGTECRETGSKRIPIGSRTSTITIHRDIFFVNYGSARNIAPSWNAENMTPGLDMGSPIGHMTVQIINGTTEASYCQNTASAQVQLARMAGATVITSRPDRISLNVRPNDIGCKD